MRDTPRLTTAMLDAALAIPATTTAPSDLQGSIAEAIRVTRQLPAPVGRRITDRLVALPRPIRLAMAAMLLVGLLVGIALVGAQVVRPPSPLVDSLTFRGDAARTGLVSGPGPGSAMAVAFQFELSGQIVTSPAVVDDVAYVGAIDGRFRALDVKRGVELWSSEINVAWSSPTVVGDLVVVGTEDRDLVALNRHTGEVAWRVPLGGYAAGSPAIVGERLYVATSSAGSRGASLPGTGSVVAVDLHTNEIAWREDLPGPSTRSIAADDSILVVPTDVGIAVGFDAATGRELWRFPTQAYADTPVIAAGKVFLAGLDVEGTRGTLAAVDLESGHEAWQYVRPSRQSVNAPVVDAVAGVVYAGTVDGDVVALRIADGTEVWTQHLGLEIASSPTMAGGVLYVPLNGLIAALRADTGEIGGTLPVDGVPFSPAISGQYLIVGTQSGNVYAITAAGPGSATPTIAGSAPSDPRPSPTATVDGHPSAEPLVEVWTRSAKDLGFRTPFFINAGPDGGLWIADSTSGRFVIVAPDGAVIDTWQPTGDAALDLIQPDEDGWGAVAFVPGGGFFVSDSDHQRVLRFDADRNLIDSFGSFGSGPGRFISPFGITVGPDGLVYVVDDSTCRIQVFEPSGEFVRTLAGSADLADRCTNNLVVSSDGTAYMASGGRGAPWQITAFAPDGQIVRRFGAGVLREPVLLAPGPKDRLYATDGTDRLVVFEKDGGIVSMWSGRGMEFVAPAPDGEVYVADIEGIVRRYSLPAIDNAPAP